MQREIIEEIEEELRNLHTQQLILDFVERLIHGMSFSSNSKSMKVEHLRNMCYFIYKRVFGLNLKTR